MEIERTLAKYISDAQYEEFPQEVVDFARNQVLTNAAATIGGSTAQGYDAILSQVREWSGKEEATILIHGGKVTAYNAALMNSYMARALDFDEGMPPGVIVGSSTVPTALAVTELIGGCSGKEFLTAIILGAEIAARLNLDERQYDGFDPTGVCTIFATTATAGKLLRLNSEQMLNALALAFNKCGGSRQGVIDGVVTPRLTQGSVSQGGIMCAQLAQRGVAGPMNFLEGAWGYFHLFGRDTVDSQAVVDGLGKRFECTNKIIFKKYPQGVATYAGTCAILDLVWEHSLVPEDIVRIDVTLTPYIYTIVGKQFEIRDNPKVDAQFNTQYTVATSLLRGSPKLKHFDEASVRDPKILDIIQKIYVSADPALEARGHLPADMKVTTRSGVVYYKSIDTVPGFPGHRLTEEDHLQKLNDCVDYAGNPLSAEKIEKVISLVGKLEELTDVRILIPYLLSQD